MSPTMIAQLWRSELPVRRGILTIRQNAPAEPPLPRKAATLNRAVADLLPSVNSRRDLDQKSEVT